jgi:acyl-CoA thioester hydrolase
MNTFEHEIAVPAAAIDDNGHVNNVVYVQWMQDIAIAHFEHVGGTPIMKAANATWVARSHYIEYLRPATAGDRVRVRTWVEDFRRVMSKRRYEFHRIADDTLLAKGETEWVLVDVATGRPKSVPAEIVSLFGLAT